VSTTPPTRTTTVLTEPAWREREAAHQARVGVWTGSHLRRRAGGQKHPVLDFLFTYYSHRPSRLARWHPGIDVALAGDAARERLGWSGYAETSQGIALDPAALTEARRGTVEFVRALLQATADRAPRLGCFGLHEWAMVYRLDQDDVRHAAWPLRLGSAGTDTVVEAARIQCSHYDAFRFFEPAARPLNLLQPTRESQIRTEQPGCLHAGMDLYKWAYKLSPFIASELVADCFELAAAIREIDMRASPYDLSATGYEPIRIESVEGRAEYVELQSGFTRRAAPLRERLIAACDAVLEWGSAASLAP
jgi:hypothetical protein